MNQKYLSTISDLDNLVGLEDTSGISFDEFVGDQRRKDAISPAL